jgi:hypothetical protein
MTETGSRKRAILHQKRELSDRRHARRRSIPYLRSAVLEVAGRNHIVTVTDLGPEGAFISTRSPVEASGKLRLRMVLPRDGREVALPCELVWKSSRFDAATGRPAGLAVRFQQLEDSVMRRVEEFAMEGFLPSARQTPAEHFEYRVFERPTIDADELNRLGLDGWRLCSTLPIDKGVRLTFLRRL